MCHAVECQTACTTPMTVSRASARDEIQQVPMNRIAALKSVVITHAAIDEQRGELAQRGAYSHIVQSGDPNVGVALVFFGKSQ